MLLQLNNTYPFNYVCVGIMKLSYKIIHVNKYLYLTLYGILDIYSLCYKHIEK